MTPLDDTIFALSSGAPPAAIGVIRVSGPAAGDALRALGGKLPPPRRASVRTLRADGGVELDRALMLWMPGPGTATGEDLGELHVHGGRAVAAAVLAALAARPGLRMAEPGEFTRRALANGVIDLAEAEGLADLLAAETEGQRRVAQAMAGGALSRRVEAWRVGVLELSAEIEAALEFAEDQNLLVDTRPIRSRGSAIARAIARLLAQPPAERLRDGVRAVIAGPPNAGKSTLLNALVERDAAITAPDAGTTRDVIEAPVVMDGLPFVLIDTAGLRDADGTIERIGIARARDALNAADVVLWLGDTSEAPPGSELIVARCDERIAEDAPGLRVSARTGEGMEALRARLRSRAEERLPREDELALNARQRHALRHAHDALADLSETSLELVAEQLAVTRRALDRIVGRAGVEDMLDSLFGRFCVGK